MQYSRTHSVIGSISFAEPVACRPDYRLRNIPRGTEGDVEYHGYRPINREEIDELTGSISGNLKDIGFFKQVDDTDMRIFFRDIISRAALSAGESKPPLIRFSLR